MALHGRISGDWIELRNAGRNPDQLEELLALDTHAPIARELAGAVEGGVVEVKRQRLAKLFDVLEDIKYRSTSMGQLEAQAGSLATLLFACFIERGFVEGTIKLPSERHESPRGASEEAKQREIREIIEDVQAIVSTDPSARMASAIKNILLQVSKYRAEMDNLKRLTQNAPEEKKKAYVQNFQKSFADIFASIRKNYADYLQERADEAQAAERGPLEGLDTKSLVRHLTREAELLSEFRSTILYVRKEQVGVLDNLGRLAERKEELLGLLDRELEIMGAARAAAGHVGGELGLDLSKRLGQELSRYLNERSRHLTPEGEAGEDRHRQGKGPASA